MKLATGILLVTGLLFVLLPTIRCAPTENRIRWQDKSTSDEKMPEGQEAIFKVENMSPDEESAHLKEVLRMIEQGNVDSHLLEGLILHLNGKTKSLSPRPLAGEEDEQPKGSIGIPYFMKRQIAIPYFMKRGSISTPYFMKRDDGGIIVAPYFMKRPMRPDDKKGVIYPESSMAKALTSTRLHDIDDKRHWNALEFERALADNNALQYRYDYSKNLLNSAGK